MEARRVSCYFFVLSCLLSVSAAAPDCVYSVYVSTGYIIGAGTNSNISAAFYEASGTGILIKNLEKWGGLMPNGYDYFERGNIDIFSGSGPCLKAPICALNLTSDGTGRHAGWNCLALEVGVKGWGKNCTAHRFSINQWLATDVSPYRLYAFKNDCGTKIRAGRSDLPTFYSL